MIEEQIKKANIQAMKDKDAHLFKATYVFEEIPKEDIIEVKELKNYE